MKTHSTRLRNICVYQLSLQYTTAAPVPSRYESRRHGSHILGTRRDTIPVQADKWEVETGGHNVNIRLKWLNYTAQAQGKTDCMICAEGRPTLTTAPARITQFNSKEGFACLLELFVDGHITGCMTNVKGLLDIMYPETLIRAIPPSFEVNLTPGYHCIQSNGIGKKVGSLPPEVCNTTRVIDLLSNMAHAHSDIWWFCGGQIIRGFSP